MPIVFPSSRHPAARPPQRSWHSAKFVLSGLVAASSALASADSDKELLVQVQTQPAVAASAAIATVEGQLYTSPTPWRSDAATLQAEKVLGAAALVATPECAGDYTDPNHPGHPRHVEMSGTQGKIKSTDDGKTFWEVPITCDASGKVVADFSSKGGPKSLAGTLEEGGIRWADGNFWASAQVDTTTTAAATLVPITKQMGGAYRRRFNFPLWLIPLLAAASSSLYVTFWRHQADEAEFNKRSNSRSLSGIAEMPESVVEMK